MGVLTLWLQSDGGIVLHGWAFPFAKCHPRNHQPAFPIMNHLL